MPGPTTRLTGTTARLHGRSAPPSGARCEIRRVTAEVMIGTEQYAGPSLGTFSVVVAGEEVVLRASIRSTLSQLTGIPCRGWAR